MIPVAPNLNSDGMPKTPSEMLGAVQSVLVPPAKPEIPAPDWDLLKALKDGKTLFVLKYRTGVQGAQSRVFAIKGDLNAARVRGQAHAKKMGFMNPIVTPFMFDLDWSEAQRERALEIGDTGSQIL